MDGHDEELQTHVLEVNVRQSRSHRYGAPIVQTSRRRYRLIRYFLAFIKDIGKYQKKKVGNKKYVSVYPRTNLNKLLEEDIDRLDTFYIYKNNQKVPKKE